MTSTATPHTGNTPSERSPEDELHLHRTTIDRTLIVMGAVLTVVLVTAGALLTWGSNFSEDYVKKELVSQHVSFPAAAQLRQEGRGDLVKYAGQQVDTGGEAQAYAGYIAGHLKAIGGGKTYSQIDDRGAQAKVAAAQAAGAPAAEIAKLQATASQLTAQRDTLFKGETLRGLLLSAYAWAQVGTIAAIASWVMYAAALAMFVLVVLGIVHLRRYRRAVAG
jgi:hypothetical protein